MPSYRAPDVLFNGPPPSLLPNDENEREWLARGGPLTDEDDDRYYDLDRSDWDDRHSVADYLDEAKRGYAVPEGGRELRRRVAGQRARHRRRLDTGKAHRRGRPYCR